jgi:hypothetical protein
MLQETVFNVSSIFQTYVASVFFYVTYVVSVLSRCYVCLQWVSSVFASVSSIFFFTLQVLYLNVSKLDQVLHMGYAWEARGA